MDDDQKNLLKIAISEFYKLNMYAKNYFGILNIKVYNGNWSPKDREALISIKKSMEMLSFQKMFENFKKRSIWQMKMVRLVF